MPRRKQQSGDEQSATTASPEELASTASPDATAEPSTGRRGGRLRRKPKEDAVAEADRAVKRKNQLTPRWWIFLMVAFMVIGLLWIVVFYLSSGLLPVPGWDNWNLVAGFGLVLVGFAMTTRWR